MTQEEFRDKKSKDYRKRRESYGIKDPVYPDEIEEAYYQGMVDADSYPHWISVEDEFPKINPNDSEWEYSDDAIVALKDGSIAMGRYERDNSIGEHYWVLYGVDKDMVVTHWMPLPTPPTISKMETVEKGGEE